MTQHTPGPWAAGRIRENPIWDILGPEIPYTGTNSTQKTCNEFVGSFHGTQSNKVNIANARLIACAPELLEKLKNLVDCIDLSKLNIRKDFSVLNHHASAMKTIAKAEGGTKP